MPRHVRTAPPTTSADLQAASRIGAVDVSTGVEASRTLVSETLGAAQTVVSQMEQLQRARLHAFGDWVRLFNTARHEAEQAQDMQALLDCSARLVSSQWSLAMEQCGAQLALWMEAQLRAAEQMREVGTSLTRQVQATVH
jgi:hypothetical protein